MKTKLFSLFIILFIHSFTNAQVTSGLIQHFKFDNSYTNEAGNVTFNTTLFGFDRIGNANSAIRIQTALPTQAIIPGLPYGNSPRSIAFWCKMNSEPDVNYGQVFSYGTGTSSNACGGSVTRTYLNFISYSNNLDITLGGGDVKNVIGSWHHFVFTYDGTTAKIYRNGQLLGSGPKTWNTINNSDIFKLGIGVGGEQTFDGFIDDLKIYDRAITEAETVLLGGDPTVSYTFNNTTLNTIGSSPFNNVGISFVNDRNGSPNSAMRVNGTQTYANIWSSLLPTGVKRRTISFWYKTTSNSGYPGVFSYGANVNSQTFGIYLNPNGGAVFQGYANDYDTGGSVAVNTWHHVAVCYNEGSVLRVYRDGVQVGITTINLNTAFSSFKLGNATVPMEFDDLKIYDYELTATQISNLYNYNTLSSSYFSQNNLEVSLYPNPVRDILNIEIENDIQSIEIYNIQGQRVLSSNQNQINVSDLASGMYLVRIQDIDNNIVTKKIAVK